MQQKSNVPLRPKLFCSEFSIKGFIKKNTMSRFLIIGTENYKEIPARCKRKAKREFRKVYLNEKILTVNVVNCIL